MQADDPTSDGKSWYAEPTVPAPERPRLTFDLDVDVCVIGGGLAGLTAAREIARRGWSVALLEGQTVGSGASGRNLGFVLPGFQEDIDRIIERTGLDHARELWALSERGVEYIRDTIRETGMPGVEPVSGWLNVSKFREDAKLNANAALVAEKFGAEVEIWPQQQVREVLRSPLYQNAIHFPRAFQIHPMNYALGLAVAAEQAGVRIFEHTPALSLDPTGIRKRVGTPSARVRSSQVVLAGNIGIEPLVPRLSASLLPVTSFVALTEPLGDKLREAVTFAGGISDSDTVDNHYRIIDGDRLLWSGGQWMWDAADSKRYARRLAADMQRAYPQLGPVSVAHVWSGTVGNAVHDMPQIGEIARGVWVASAFAGHGFNTTALAGELIARGIAENDQTWRLFAPYDLVWAGGTAGRVTYQMRHWAHRLRERFDALFLRDEMPRPSAPAETVIDEPAPVEAMTLEAAPAEAAPPLAAESFVVPKTEVADEDPAVGPAEPPVTAEMPPVPASRPASAGKTGSKPARRRQPAKPKSAAPAKPKAKSKARKQAKQPAAPEKPASTDTTVES